MRFHDRTLEQLADMICGNNEACPGFVHRSSSDLTAFFHDIGFEYRHDGSTPKWWVKRCLEEILDSPDEDEKTPLKVLLQLINRLMAPDDATKDDPNREQALNRLNAVLSCEGFEAFCADGKRWDLNDIRNRRVLVLANPH